MTCGVVCNCAYSTAENLGRRMKALLSESMSLMLTEYAADAFCPGVRLATNKWNAGIWGIWGLA